MEVDLLTLQKILFDKTDQDGWNLVVKLQMTLWFGNKDVTVKTQDDYSTAYSLLMTLAVFYAIENIPEALILLSETQKMALAELEKDFYAMMSMFEARAKNAKGYPEITI